LGPTQHRIDHVQKVRWDTVLIVDHPIYSLFEIREPVWITAEAQQQEHGLKYGQARCDTILPKEPVEVLHNILLKKI
jgi:hypothetical protein